MKATIKQVAAMAGVSAATVSKYLNGFAVKERNRQSIARAVEALEYQINPAARSLRTNKTFTIGVLIPELNHEFATGIISIVEDELMPLGYSTIVCDFKSDPMLERRKLEFLKNRNVDALIWMPLGAQGGELSQIGMPTVFLDRAPEGIRVNSVTIDNRLAAYEAVTHLLDHGHTDIAVLCGPQSIYTARWRLKGYLDAFAAKGVPVKEEWVLPGNYTEKCGYRLTQRLLSGPRRPSAIFAANNELTVGSVMALIDQKIKIPEQISFVGFDNARIAGLLRPKLSVVLQPTQEMGRQTAKLILETLKCNETVNSVQLKAQFFAQDSVQMLD